MIVGLNLERRLCWPKVWRRCSVGRALPWEARGLVRSYQGSGSPASTGNRSDQTPDGARSLLHWRGEVRDTVFLLWTKPRRFLYDESGGIDMAQQLYGFTYNPQVVRGIRASMGNMTREEFATVVRCSPDTVRGWENGRCPAAPFVDEIRHACDVHQVPYPGLFNRSGG